MPQLQHHILIMKYLPHLIAVVIHKCKPQQKVAQTWTCSRTAQWVVLSFYAVGGLSYGNQSTNRTPVLAPMRQRSMSQTNAKYDPTS